jgi:hypothetical protein
LKITFAVTETGPDAAAGDYFTALELGRALKQRFGWTVQYVPEANWDEPIETDVLVSMLDHFDPRAMKAIDSKITTVAWARNWFNQWAARPWLAQYDILLASSKRGAEAITEQAKRLCSVFPIATNPERFDIKNRELKPTLDYVFTGSYWGAPRDIVDALGVMPASLLGAVYGKHWEKCSEIEHLYRGFVNYDELPTIYAQSRIVIDDANHQTKAWGAANSRVFDALAAGCLVITNSKTVSDEVFDGLLPVYQKPEHLKELISYYSGHARACETLLTSLRETVFKQYCYQHRAIELKIRLQRSVVLQRKGF